MVQTQSIIRWGAFGTAKPVTKQDRWNLAQFLCCLDSFQRFLGSRRPCFGSKKQKYVPGKKLPKTRGKEEKKVERLRKFLINKVNG